MIEIEKVTDVFSDSDTFGVSFKPSDVQLNSFLLETPKDSPETAEITVEEEQLLTEDVQTFVCKDDFKSTVVAVDSTSFILGYIPDGVVGVVRASVITNLNHSNNRSLQLYGPYLIAVNNQNNDIIHTRLNKVVFGIQESAKAPVPLRMIERIRSFLEKYIQMQIACNLSDTVLLFDGSLIGGTVDTPMGFQKKLLSSALGQKNSIMAISKNTTLTLATSRKNILSLLEDVQGPCFIGKINDRISQDKGRYLGDIYISRLALLGEAFRVDIPRDNPISDGGLFSIISSLCGEYGYPEELKLAHMCCVHSSLELLELQAAAIGIHGMTIKEELRKKIFPL